MKLKTIITRQMKYWQELVHNTSLKNAMNIALRDIKNDGKLSQRRTQQKIEKQNHQADLRIKHIHYLMKQLEPPIIIFYPNGSQTMRFATGKKIHINNKKD